MARIGFLACETTLPGADRRRADAFEHDLYVSALEPALISAGHEMIVIDWEAPIARFDTVDLAVLGTAWNYQDKEGAFLARLEELEASGCIVCNPASLVRWNIDKRYLATLASSGAPSIKTLWFDRAEVGDLERAFAHFGTDKVVVKRQVGAGAEGQSLVKRGALPARDWTTDKPVMVQPFLPAIQQDGEYSFVFVDGEFSHALQKIAAEGDYRIQSLYGGIEKTIHPDQEDLAAAQNVLQLVPFPTPLYARIDMVRGEQGSLLVMEVEMIEPYLYPEQGPELGARLARAITRRLEARSAGTT